MTRAPGPIEERAWPERLRARVVRPGPSPCIHGYDVSGDLTRHYGVGEVILLALTGEAPTREIGRAFEAALVFTSACPVNEAPTHAAVLARSIGAPLSNALSSGLLVACEAARSGVEELFEFEQWLRSGMHGPVPDCARAEPAAADVAQLRQVLIDLSASELAPPPELDRTAAALYVFWHAGLTTSDQWVAALVWANTLSIAAEACAAPRGGLTTYPVRLPDFRYRRPSNDDR